jgi:hypothetical protein
MASWRQEGWQGFAAEATMRGSSGIVDDQNRRLNQRLTATGPNAGSARKQVGIGEQSEEAETPLAQARDPSFTAPMRTHLFDDKDGMDYPLCVDAVSTN